MPRTDVAPEDGFEKWFRSSQMYRRVWVPHGIDRISIFRALYRHRKYAGGVLLDVGCGTKPYAEIYAGRVTRHWGLDLPTVELRRSRCIDVYASAPDLPIESNTIDTVLAVQMLGYVYEPERLLREAARVLRPGGYLILTYSLGTGQADPTDYYRFTPAFYRKALANAGLHTELIEARSGTLGTVGENISTLIYYRKTPSGLRLKFRRALCHLIQQVFSTADRWFFDPHGGIGHIVIARKPEA